MPRTAVYLETGSKRVFACAVEWPGWCRVGKDETLALEALEAYASRYARVAREAGVDFPKTIGFEIVERRPGDVSTDFGVPGKISEADAASLTPKARERLAALVEAAWTVFDKVAANAPQELRKGPRGGGRDRDKIKEHVLGADIGYAYQIGVDVRANRPEVDDKRAIQALRNAVLDVLRGPKDPTPNIKRPWPRRYAARRIAWHALDHAWEIEDRSEA
jgi:hypothetical protein